MAYLNFLLDKSVDVAGKALKEKDIFFCEKCIAEHSTWPLRKLVTSSWLGIPQQTTRRAIDINIAYLIFVIFFTRATFLENKIYTEKTASTTLITWNHLSHSKAIRITDTENHCGHCYFLISDIEL